MTTQSKLTTNANEGIVLVCSDVEMLHREMIKEDPMNAKTMKVLDILAKATELKEDISQLLTKRD